MSLTKKTISAGISRGISLVIKGMLQLGVLIFFARYLSQDEFGAINIVTSLMAFITLFTEIGLGPALIQKQVVSEKDLQVASFGSLILALGTYVLLFIAAPFIADFYNAPVLKNILRVVGIAFVFASISNVSFSLLKKELEFKAILTVELTAFVIGYGLVGVYLAYMGMGVWAYVIAIVVQSIVMCALFQLIRPQMNFKWHKQEFGHLFQFAGWLTIENVLNMLARQSDIFITGKLLGIGALGLYGRAYQLLDIPNQYIGMALDNVLFPAMAKKKNDPKSIVYSFLRGISIVNLVMFPISLFLALQAENLILMLFGAQWIEAAPVLQILCLTLPFKTTVKIVDSLVRALGAFRGSAKMKLLFLISMAIFTVAGSGWGIKGVALGVNAAICLNYIAMTVLAWRLIHFSLKTYVYTYYPGILLFFITGIANISLVFAAILGNQNTMVVFVICSVLTVSFCLATLLLFPRFFGENWRWLLAQLLGYIPPATKLAKFRSFLEGRLLVGN